MRRSHAGGTIAITTALVVLLPSTSVFAAPPMPRNSTAPTTSGAPVRDGSFVATTGTWTGDAPIAYAYQWQRCTAAGASCANISGATAPSYSIVTADVGHELRVGVTATNSRGTATAYSATTAVVVIPPSNTAAPTISGTPQDLQTLTAAPGAWAGTTPLTYAYQWQQCTGGTCNAITGATASTYAVVSGDVGQQLAVQVTASNSGASAKAASAPTGTVTAAPPVNTKLPGISGTLRDGSTVTADSGTWTGTPTLTFTYQWEDCGADDSACTSISAATSSSYSIDSTLVGHTLAVQITASNGGGSATATSNATAAVAAAPPANKTATTVSGSAQGGSTLTAAPGTWAGTPPLALGYQWQRCDTAGANCVDIGSATGVNYTAGPRDIGTRLRVNETATNTAGSATTPSAVTTAVTPVGTPPTNTAAPAITGTAKDGSTLTASTGTWTGDSPIVYDYLWMQCNSAGASCTGISGAPNATTYALTSNDVGRDIVVQVTASNNGGSSTARSTAAGPVAAIPPANTQPPAISGTAQDGSTLSVSTGTWTGTAPITYTYQWRRCATTCADINGATIATYQLTGNDVGATIKAQVTATNAATAVSATSTATAAVQATPPTNTALPSITGTPQDGSTLSALSGTWTGTTPITYTYQWQRCGSTCTNESNGIKSTYVVTSADVGSKITVRVTATNAAGNVTVAAPQTGTVASAGPLNQTPPAISGSPQVGQTLTTTTGAWSGTTPMTYTYQWLQCTAAGASCVAETQSATSSTYLVRTYDQGMTLVVQVTAQNTAGSGTARSTTTSAVTASATAVSVALWHMEDTDQTMRDSSGYGNDGSLVSVTTGQTGATGSAFGFFASPSRVVVNSSKSLNPGSTKMTVTVHVRFKAAPSTSTGDYDLVRKGLSTTAGGDWKVEIMPTGQASCTGVGSSGSGTLTAGPNLADNLWHTIVCTETTGSLKLTVDGSSVGSKSASIGAISNTDALTVAAKIIDGDQYNGVMDEVSLKMG